MTKLFLLILLIFSSSCTIWSPLQLGDGKKIAGKYEECGWYLFGLGNSDKPTFSNILNKTQLNKNEVVAVDKSWFHFLLGIYWEQCTVLSLTEEGVSKVKKFGFVSEMIDDNNRSFPQATELSDCNRYGGKTKRNCLSEVRKYSDSEQ